MTPKHYLEVGFYNPGSLAKNDDEFILAAVQHSLNVIEINEIWLQSSEEGKAPSLPGFALHSAPRPGTVCGGRGGGVAFYVRKGIRVSEHPVCVPVEQMWLKININNNKLIIGTAYRPQWISVDTILYTLTDCTNALDHNLLLALNLDPVFTHDSVIGFDLDPDFRPALDLDPVLTLDSVIGFDLDHNLLLVLDLDPVFTHDSVIGFDLDPDFRPALDLDPVLTLDSVIGFDLDHNLLLVLDLDPVLILDSVIGFDLDPDLRPALDPDFVLLSMLF